MSKNRTYVESCIDVGFEFTIKDHFQQPQCIFFSNVLGIFFMKPSILKAHFALWHFLHEHHDYTSLLVKSTRFRAAGILPSLEFVCEDKSALKASYDVD